MYSTKFQDTKSKHKIKLNFYTNNEQSKKGNKEKHSITISSQRNKRSRNKLSQGGKSVELQKDKCWGKSELVKNRAP